MSNQEIKEWVCDVEKFLNKHVFKVTRITNDTTSTDTSSTTIIHNHYHNDSWWGRPWFSPFGYGSQTVVNNYIGDSPNKTTKQSEDDEGFSTSTKVILGIGLATITVGGAAYLGSVYEYWCELTEVIKQYERMENNGISLLMKRSEWKTLNDVYNDLVHLRRMFYVTPVTGAVTVTSGLCSVLTSSSSLLLFAGVSLTAGSAVGAFNYMNKDYSNASIKTHLGKLKTMVSPVKHEDLIKLD